MSLQPQSLGDLSWDFVCRETASSGTSPGGSGTKSPSSFPRPRSLPTHATPCSVASAQTPRASQLLAWGPVGAWPGCLWQWLLGTLLPTLLSPSPRLLATCSADQTCKIWRTSNFSLMTELSIKSGNPGESSRGWMWGCAFSGDSQYIVTGEPPPLPGLHPGWPVWTWAVSPVLLRLSLQLLRTTWPGSGVWRLARSRGSMVVTRKQSSAWPSMTVC